MDIASLMSKAMSKGQSLIGSMPDSVNGLISKLGNLADGVKIPDINLDPSQIKDMILGKTGIDVDPQKLSNGLLGDIKPPETDGIVSSVEEAANGASDESRYEQIATSIIPSFEIPSMDEMSSIGSESDIKL